MEELPQGTEDSSLAAGGSELSREVRVSDWKSYDAAGFNLPERAAISNWQTRRLGTPLSFVGYVAIMLLALSIAFVLAIYRGIAIVQWKSAVEQLEQIRSRIESSQTDWNSVTLTPDESPLG